MLTQKGTVKFEPVDMVDSRIVNAKKRERTNCTGSRTQTTTDKHRNWPCTLRKSHRSSGSKSTFTWIMSEFGSVDGRIACPLLNQAKPWKQRSSLGVRRPLRACLFFVCVTAVCVSESFWERGLYGAVSCRLSRDLPRPQGRRASHIPYPSTPPLLFLSLSPSPHPRPVAVGIFRRTLCQTCLREDVVARVRHSFFELCLSSSSTFGGEARSYCRGTSSLLTWSGARSHF